MSSLLAVAAGGAVGASLRWSAGLLAVRALGVSLLWSTLTVNVLGSLAIGALLGFMAHATDAAPRVDERWRLFLVAGVLGGFTTFSAFAGETALLFEKGAVARALGYALATNALCLLGAWAAYRLAAP